MYAPLAACRRNFTPTLPARRKCHKRFSAGVAPLRRLAGEVALVLVAVHENPLPNPPRKGEGAGKDLRLVPRN